jgi:hypothetical protein
MSLLEVVLHSCMQMHVQDLQRFWLPFKIRLLDVECTLCDISVFFGENKVNLVLSPAHSLNNTIIVCSISKSIIVVV